MQYPDRPKFGILAKERRESAPRRAVVLTPQQLIHMLISLLLVEHRRERCRKVFYRRLGVVVDRAAVFPAELPYQRVRLRCIKGGWVVRTKMFLDIAKVSDSSKKTRGQQNPEDNPPNGSHPRHWVSEVWAMALLPRGVNKADLLVTHAVILYRWACD